LTASHFNKDNGVKLVDPRGEMLEAAWEGHATVFANAATTDDFIDAFKALVQALKIDLSKPARVIYARDTRPSGPPLISALEDGFGCIGVEARDIGVTTTPILHYLVSYINARVTKENYGDDAEEGYFEKLSESFMKLVVSLWSCIF
jgi:phosphoacetylglucosamine mutase